MLHVFKETSQKMSSNWQLTNLFCTFWHVHLFFYYRLIALSGGTRYDLGTRTSKYEVFVQIHILDFSPYIVNIFLPLFLPHGKVCLSLQYLSLFSVDFLWVHLLPLLITHF